MSISKSSVLPKHSTEEIKEVPITSKLSQSTVGTRLALKMLLISANLATNPDLEKYNNS